MTSQSKSKAQRRAENQQRAAERRAAELRAKRMRIGIRVGGAVVVIALVVVLIVVVTGGSNSRAAQRQGPPHRLARSPFPPPCPPRGCSRRPGRPVPRPSRSPSGPKLATLLNAATGQTVDGIQCQAGEQTVVHVHTHLTIFVNGKAQVIPYGIGIPGFQAVSTPQGPVRRDGQLLLLAARPRQRRDHPHRVAEHDGDLHPGPVLRRVGRPAQHDAGRAGHREGDGVLHLTGQEGRCSTPATPGTSRWATTTRSSWSSARRSWPPSRSPTGAAVGSVDGSGRLAYPTFQRAVDSALWSPPSSEEKIAGA